MTRTSPRRTTLLRAALAAVALPGLAGLSGLAVAAPAAPVTPPAAADPFADSAAACSALTGLEVPAADIGHPTRGAVVETASLVVADSKPGRPEYCQVRGRVRSSDPTAPPINFQVNLPTAWNDGSVQFGGGGFNGVVITGLGNLPGTGRGASGSSEVPEPVAPIDRGYVTFGGDSGNAVGDGPAGSFGLNEESLANYAGESVKRTRDAAMGVVAAYYGHEPQQQYFVGGSKGGHEGLVAAQRYGSDYDGVIAYYPANQNQAMVISWYHVLEAWRSTGGALGPDEQALLAGAVRSTCDGLDGLDDGVVSDVRGCEGAFDLEDLRCEVADSGEACLTAAQVRTVEAAATPFRFRFALAHGVREIGPYPVLRGAGLTPSMIGAYAGFTDPVIRYFVLRDAEASSAGFDYRDHVRRVKQLSRQLDATDPRLDAFVAGGGKLILVQGSTDFLVPQGATDAYYERVQQRYGADTRSFVRHYTQPGFGHGSGDFGLTWDSLTALEDWAEEDRAPEAPVARDDNPGSGGRSMPLCEFPAWPQYQDGDPTQAASFACVGDPA